MSDGRDRSGGLIPGRSAWHDECRFVRVMLLSRLLLSIVVIGSVSFTSRSASALACSGNQMKAHDVHVDVTPSVPCIAVDIAAGGCGDTLVISIANRCDEGLAVPSDLLRCETERPAEKSQPARTCVLAPR